MAGLILLPIRPLSLYQSNRMVKHGMIRAIELKPGTGDEVFRCKIDRNAGQESSRPLMDTDHPKVTFDLLTRRSKTPFGTGMLPFTVADEIVFKLTVQCKRCHQKGSFEHGKKSVHNGRFE